MKFQKVYIEITNICGLSCLFCPSKIQNKTMPLDFFQKILTELQSFTQEIALHVLGDPMVVSNLKSFLDEISNLKMKAHITTSGFHMHNSDVLFHPSIKQINFSLNSFDKNDTKLSFERYMQRLLDFCDQKLALSSGSFINFRLWNKGDEKDRAFNQKVYDILSSHFEIDFNPNERSIRLAKKILLHQESYFEWPSLENTTQSDGYCNGLITHFGILCDGRVVPCCLDHGGVITLGNLQHQSLNSILSSQKVQDIRDGFFHQKAVEHLCQVCAYKKRFIQKN